MTARKGLFVVGPSDAGVTAPIYARLALQGLLSAVGPTPIDAGAGILWGPGDPGKVTGSSSGPNMKYLVNPAVFATQRGTAAQGLYLWANDGQVTVDSGAPAPGSGSRWDIVWARAKDGSSSGPDSDSDTGGRASRFLRGRIAINHPSSPSPPGWKRTRSPIIGNSLCRRSFDCARSVWARPSPSTTV